jgi:hypothetical protein
VIEHVQVTSTALEKAAAAELARTEKQAAVSALIPQVCDTMLEHERITPQQREKLAEMLQDPVQALELMIKVAGHRNQDELARLGSGVDPSQPGQVKTAGANGGGSYDPSSSLSDPNVGARTTRIKQSSVNLFQGLGLSAPVS